MCWGSWWDFTYFKRSIIFKTFFFKVWKHRPRHTFLGTRFFDCPGSPYVKPRASLTRCRRRTSLSPLWPWVLFCFVLFSQWKKGFMMPCLHFLIYLFPPGTKDLCLWDECFGIENVAWFQKEAELTGRHKALSLRSASVSHCHTWLTQATENSDLGAQWCCSYSKKAGNHCLFVNC